MEQKTIETIYRHAKGIVAAMGKNCVPMVVTYNGVPFSECTTPVLLEAWDYWQDNRFLSMESGTPLMLEMKARGLDLKLNK